MFICYSKTGVIFEAQSSCDILSIYGVVLTCLSVVRSLASTASASWRRRPSRTPTSSAPSRSWRRPSWTRAQGARRRRTWRASPWSAALPARRPPAPRLPAARRLARLHLHRHRRVPSRPVGRVAVAASSPAGRPRLYYLYISRVISPRAVPMWAAPFASCFVSHRMSMFRWILSISSDSVTSVTAPSFFELHFLFFS